ARVIEAGERPRRRPAADRLPRSTETTKARRASSRSIQFCSLRKEGLQLPTVLSPPSKPHGFESGDDRTSPRSEGDPMSRIAAIDPSTAPATVKQLLDGVQKGMGVIPNLFRVAAQSPAALESLALQFGVAGKGSFDARTREAIALTVSESN